jgi:hypothetical protein
MWRAVAVALLAAAVPCAAKTPLPVQSVVEAELILPTDRYDHAVLGDGVEWGGLRLTVDTCPPCADRRLQLLTLRLPEDRVFEDVEARVVDVTGDGLAEVIVVETDIARGAALAVYDAYGSRVATSFIGQRHRWLAPAGVGDFDGDGQIEIAYVDRPHLRKELVFVRLEGGQLRKIAHIPNLANHQIGDDFITGGVRNCGQGDELVLASGDWAQAMVVTMAGSRVAGPVDRIPALLACRG